MVKFYLTLLHKRFVKVYNRNTYDKTMTKMKDQDGFLVQDGELNTQVLPFPPKFHWNDSKPDQEGLNINNSTKNKKERVSPDRNFWRVSHWDLEDAPGLGPGVRGRGVSDNAQGRAAARNAESPELAEALSRVTAVRNCSLKVSLWNSRAPSLVLISPGKAAFTPKLKPRPHL